MATNLRETTSPGELRYADELVSFVREQTGDHFHIVVGTHPETLSAETALANFKRRVDAGANSVLTQYFFDPNVYYRFVDACERIGLNTPIVPGIIPITNHEQLARFSDKSGVEIPPRMRKRLQGSGGDLTSMRAFGLDVVTEVCQQLLRAGAPGLHFYSLNRADPTSAI